MENIDENKRIKYIWQDKKYTRDTINSINHTNINNNINITNYYPSPSQNFCNKGTFTFINDNATLQNAVNYKITTTTHKSKNNKDISPTPSSGEKKYHQCQSPYMKKILPSSKREKSEEANRIINIYKSSPSTKYFNSIKKKPLKSDFYKENNNRKNVTQNINNNNKQNIRDNYYLDLSSDDINNKFSTNRNYYNYYYSNNNTNNNNNNKSEILKIKNNCSKLRNKPPLTVNKSMISNESNGKESLINILQKPMQIKVKNKEPLFKVTSLEKNNLIAYNFNSPKMFKSQKNLNIRRKKDISVEKKLSQYIILIQSVIRGYLLRVKLSQYLFLYERIKKAVYIIKFKLFQKVKYILYFKLKNYINKKFSKYRNYWCLTPSNHISFELKTRNNKIISNDSFNLKQIRNNNNQDINIDKNKNQSKNNNEMAEIHKELNKKKIDYAVAQKKIKELISENKKIQNINNIIVRDNKQLALKIKNAENYRFKKLEIQNMHFYYISLSMKYDTKIKINNLLLKILFKKQMSLKTILYKYFYKFYINSKILCVNENNNKNTLIIENNNFIINKNIIEKNVNIINDNEINIQKRNKKLNMLIKKKNLSLYICRNILEKWMLRALIFKNKEFIREKKKKKKEKFKQRKARKMYGYYMEKNDKKNNDEENENSAESDDFEVEEKSSNKYGSNKKNNYYE